MQRRGWWGAIWFWEKSWSVIVYSGTKEPAESDGATENAALMAVVLAILEGGNDVTSI
jgi:hypothetical protein